MSDINVFMYVINWSRALAAIMLIYELKQFLIHFLIDVFSPEDVEVIVVGDCD